MENRLKEVYFYDYCPKCIHYGTDENEYPCDICLSLPGREYSHRPEFFEEKPRKEKE